MSQTEPDNKLQNGIQLARAGQMAEAEAVFDKLLGANPLNQEALIWKAAVTGDVAVSVACLEKVLRLNPDSQRAKQGLIWARQRLEANYQGQTTTKSNPVSDQPVAKTGKFTPPPNPAIPDTTVANNSSRPTTKPSNQPPTPSATPPQPTAQPKTAKTADSQPTLTSTGAKRVAKAETIAEAATYKKSRLSSAKEKFAAVELPPEAYAPPAFAPNAATKNRAADSKQKRRARPKETLSDELSANSALRAAMPKFKLRVADHVAQMAETGYEAARSPLFTHNPALPWVLFGVAIVLALLTFVLSGLAALLGGLALLLALAGVVLYVLPEKRD